MKFSKEQIDFMHTDMECDFGYSKIIEETKKRFEKEGRDFYSEYNDYIKNK